MIYRINKEKKFLYEKIVKKNSCCTRKNFSRELLYTEETADANIFHAQSHKYNKRCACCNSIKVHHKDSKERMFRGCDFPGGINNYIKITTYKLHCLSCGKTRWMKLPFTVGKLPMIKSFINHVIDSLTKSTSK